MKYELTRHLPLFRHPKTLTRISLKQMQVLSILSNAFSHFFKFIITLHFLHDCISPFLMEFVFLVLFPSTGHRMTWQAYHKTSDIHGYLDYLAQTYPNLCTVESIGRSVQGRQLKVLRFVWNVLGERETMTYILQNL